MLTRFQRIAALTVVLGVITTGVLTGSVAARPSGGALPPELVRVLDVAEMDDVPDDAAMLAVNITATRGAEKGHITAYPCGELPEASNVNYLADQNVPNLALVRISDAGTFCISTSAVVDLVVDVVGYVPADSGITPLAEPFRAIDTRQTATLEAGETLRVPITSIDGVVAGADLVMANITAIARGGTGYLTTHPCTPTVPNTSSVNYGPKETNANFVASRIDETGAICITTSERADVIVDVAASATDGIDTLPTPVRIVDTRTTGTRPAGSTLTVDIDGLPEVPDTATAAVYNLTAANAREVGHATSHPCLLAAPLASNLNYVPGPARANGTITKLSRAGQFCITTSAQVDLIVDLIGYTTDTTHYVAVTPRRIEDTREGWAPECELMLVSTWVLPHPNAVPGEMTVSVVDRRTGRQSELPSLETPLTGDIVAIDSDCEHVLHGARSGGIERIDIRTGVREGLSARTATRFEWLDDGTAVAWVHGESPEVHTELIDLETGAWILRYDEETGPPPGSDLHVDETLSWAAFRSEQGFEIWDVDSGTLEFFDPRSGRFEMSPDGLYVSRGFVKEHQQWCEILTRFGDTVYEHALGPAGPDAAPCEWASPGTLFSRVGALETTTMRLDLFGAATVLAEPVQVSALERSGTFVHDFR